MLKQSACANINNITSTYLTFVQLNYQENIDTILYGKDCI